MLDGASMVVEFETAALPLGGTLATGDVDGAHVNHAFQS